uniref:FHA domain-containing protein n=1 Tax=Anopheles dirus TaxID=7168 RepID=A0A182N5B4_9DIPT
MLASPSSFESDVTDLKEVCVENVYYLVPQPMGHTVGRTGTDMIITGDDSISRNHAMLQPVKDVLKLTDTASRYGSYVNDSIAKNAPISKDLPTDLTVGDRVRFGRCGSIWTVGRVRFRCLTSTLVMTPQLKTLLEKLGVELLPSYTSTLTHLIMPSITFTTKFLQCLVGQVPIVTPDFFNAIDSDCIGQGKALPMVEEFLPVCTESHIRNMQQFFHPNSTRRDLFRGKEFIFLSNTQFVQFEEIVKLAGGVCLCAQRERIGKSRFLKPNVITIKLKEASASQSQTFDSLSQYISARGRRMVPDPEIGLAIMYSSMEKYCNPDYSFAFNVEECNEQPSTDCEMLATNTVPQTESSSNVKTNTSAEMHTIPETEHCTERKPAQTKHAATSPASSKLTAANSCTPYGSSFVKPSAVPTPVSVPEERRKSKRLQEEATSAEQTGVGSDSGMAKRTRRNAPPTESASDSSLSLTVPEQRRASKRMQTLESATEETATSEGTSIQAKRARCHVSPSESVSYSPAVDSKKGTESEQNQIELPGADGIEATIPETQPTFDTASSQALQAHGFRAVNRDPPEPAGKSKARRAANLQLAPEDDDAFNFDEIVPVKKSRTQKANKSIPKPTDMRPVAARDDLFCFEDISVSQQRRTKDTGIRTESNQTSTTADASATTSLSPAVVTEETSTFGKRLTADSILHDYWEFIKPKELDTSRADWRSSTMCGLKQEDAKEHSPSDVTIKTEPMEEVDGLDADSKGWLLHLSSVLQVLDINIKPVAHRPTDANGEELACVTSDGRRNYKAFTKVCTMWELCVVQGLF